MDRVNDLRRTALICAFLCALTLASFWPVVQNGFINFDDPEYVTENPHVASGLSWENVGWAFRHSYAGNWHPLTWISHMLDAQLYGLNPTGHHVTNLVFHAVNGVLLFLVLRWLTGATWRSALVAALFAVHPLRVESVAWVSERKDVLSAFFFMLTLWSYGEYARHDFRSGATIATSNGPEGSNFDGQPKPRWLASGFYLLALLSFSLGLMSKAMLVTVPFVLLLLDYWPLGRFLLPGRNPPTSRNTGFLRCLVEKIPFLALAIGASIVTLLVQSNQGAVSSMRGLPLFPRLANAIVSYLKYMAKVVWPSELAVFYPHPDTTYPASTQWPLWQVAAAALVILLLTLWVLHCMRARPYLAVGWFWFLGMLVPVIGLVQVGAQAMADRYTYLSTIGLLLMVIWGAGEVLGPRLRWKWMAGALGTAAVTAYAVVSGTQTTHWRDSITLFEHTLRVTSDNATAHFNLGAAFEERGKFGLAMAHYQAALQIDPSYVDAWYNIGHVLAAQGKLEQAVEQYRWVLDRKPDHAFAHNNLGNALLALGKPEEAIAEYTAAIHFAPDYPAAHNNLGKVLADQGKMEEAGRRFREALRLKPDYFEARAGLALSLAAEGHYQESLSHWQAVAQRRPENAEIHFNLGNVLTELGRTNEAREQYGAALQCQPHLADQNVELGDALARQGQLLAAEARFIAASRLRAEDPAIHQRLGRLLAKEGKAGQAIPHFQEACRLDPGAEHNYDLALALVINGEAQRAIAEYRRTLQLKPDWAAAMNDLAWILATHPDARLRDGVEAVRLAQRVCQLSGETEPRYWGTLDAAYAETALFPEAIATAQKTRQLALAAGLEEIAEAAQHRLELYRAGQPFRQSVSGSSERDGK